MIAWACLALLVNVGWVSKAGAWSNTSSILKGSLTVNSAIAGGGNQRVIDGTASTNVFLKELAWKCVNPKKKSDTAQGTPFQLSEERFEVASQKEWSCKKNGECPFSFVITDAELDAIIFAKFGVHLTAADLCPNANWHLAFAVTRADVAQTVSKSAENSIISYRVGLNRNYTTPPPGMTPPPGLQNSDCNGNPSLNDNRFWCFDKYLSCDPGLSGIEYEVDGAPAAGRVDECIVFRDAPSLATLWAPTAEFLHQDAGGCTYPRADLQGSDFYHCACLDHGKQNPSSGIYQPTGPSANDPECLLGATIVDGIY
jgi:hypothetical protein